MHQIENKTYMIIQEFYEGVDERFLFAAETARTR
jgi:hypothetical protein